MAEEPQPSAVREGASTPSAPTAEDRKVGAALSSLDARDGDDEPGGKKEVDSKALGEAMKNLSVEEKGNGAPTATEKKVVVKVNPADVALLVSELELSRPKATELLRVHEGDIIKAMTAFVSVSA